MRPLFYVAPLACVLFPLVSLAARPAVSPARPAAPDLFGKSIRPFMTKHCSSCHNAKASSGGLNLDAFTSAASVDREHHAWELIAQKLRTGEMPPKGLPRPPEAEVKAVTGWISGEFQRLEGQSRPDPGRVTARRLNRAEYNNTVRDLLGVDFRPADDFPQDDSGYGFDNIGDVLSLSPVLMEKYLTAAERVARTALFGPEEMKPTVVQLRPPGRSIRPTAKVPAEYDETGLTLPNTLHVTHRFPVDGEYAFRVVLGGERPGGSEPLQLGFWIDGEKVQERTYDPEGKASFALDRQDLAGQSTDFHVRVPAGDHWLAVSILRMYEGMPASYGGVNPSMRPVPRAPDFTRTLQPPPNATPEQLEAFKMRLERIRQRQREREMEKAAVNVARITFVEVNGPHEQKLGPCPEALKKIYTCGHLNGGHKAWCDRKIVGDLARRAFRRPVTAAEVSRYTRLVAMARVQGDSFEEGVCLAIQGILVSPHFLFRIEKDPTAG
ncbi:MAG TPA: DUF1587 domain-containing protein, partial [Armatimonadota bacterium]|nr:DUF1587 domain-containing protein [Armatimonadota bacterium]